MAHVPMSPNMQELQDPALTIPLGGYSRLSSVNKFGRNTDVDTTQVTVWDGGGLYNWSSTADITDVVSSDAGDTMVLQIQGLDADWNLVNQVATLTGTTSVALTTPLLRVFRMFNTSGTSALGTIQCGVGSTTTSFTAGNLRAQITLGFEQTLMSLYTVPAGHTAYLTGGWASINKGNASGAIDINFLGRADGGVFRIQTTIGLIAAGTSQTYLPFNPYRAFPEKTDIEVRATGSTNNFDVSAGFDLILYNNE